MTSQKHAIIKVQIAYKETWKCYCPFVVACITFYGFHFTTVKECKFIAK